MHTLSVPDGAVSAPIGSKRVPERPELALGYDLTTEEGVLRYARELARRTIMATQMDARTIDASIQSVSVRYRLKSFLRKLWKNERVVIRAYLLFRLERAHQEAMRSLENYR